MSNYSLSICIPSKRSLEESRESICSAIGFCESTKSELIISDNSGNIKKSETWNKTPLIFMKYIKNDDKDNLRWSDNWFKGIENCSGKFIGMLSDDDLLLNLEKSNLDYMQLDEDNIVGIKPIISLWCSDAGIYKLNKYKIDGNKALDRVKQQYNLAEGNNTTYYSFFRNNILKDIYKLLKFHPTKGGYLDWAITFACVASGKVLVDGSKLLVYKNNNWYGDKNFINKQTLKLYADCRLGEIGHRLSFFFRALDVFILIMRKNSNLPFDEKLEVAEFLFDNNLEIFLTNFTNYQKYYYSDQVVDIVEKIRLEENIELKLKKCLNVLIAQFSETLASDYKLFYKKSIGNNWGNVF